MSDLLLFATLGLGAGALIATLGLGIVLTFRGAGVVNFAAGAIAMYVGYVYWDAKVNGAWPVPPLPNPLALIEGVASWFGAELDLPSWPTSLSLGGPLPTLAAVAVALLTAAALGGLLYGLVFRLLRTAPPLANVVASIGVLLMLQAVVVRRFGSAPRGVDPLVSTSSISMAGRNVPVDRLVLAGVALVLAVVIATVFRFTRIGWTMRAAAESGKSATLVGINAGRLAALTWVVSSVVVGMLGILAAPVIQLNPTLLPALVVPALAAALLGRMTSFLITCGAGLGIGALQSLITFVQTKSWWPHHGAEPIRGGGELLVLVVIVIALVAGGSRLPVRGDLETQRLPFAPLPKRSAPMLLGTGGLAMAALLLGSFQLRQAVTISVIFAILCLSLVVITGFIGQVALAQMAIAGIAGFALSSLADRQDVDFPWSPVLAILAATAVGVLVSLPALRVRGVSLAVMTLASAVAIEAFVFNNQLFNGGSRGARVGAPQLFGLSFGPNSPFVLGDGTVPSPGFGLFCLALLVAVGLCVVRLRRSRVGRAMLAVRVNERAAASSGVNVVRMKLLAVTISSAIAALGGVLLGYLSGVVAAGSFGFAASLTLLAFAYMGGISSLGGGLIGGLLVSGGVVSTILQNNLQVSAELIVLLGGFGVIITTLFNPTGIAGALRDLRGMVGDRRQRGRQRVRLSDHCVPVMAGIPQAGERS